MLRLSLGIVKIMVWDCQNVGRDFQNCGWGWSKLSLDFKDCDKELSKLGLHYCKLLGIAQIVVRGCKNCLKE